MGAIEGHRIAAQMEFRACLPERYSEEPAFVKGERAVEIVCGGIFRIDGKYAV